MIITVITSLLFDGGIKVYIDPLACGGTDGLVGVFEYETCVIKDFHFRTLGM